MLQKLKIDFNFLDFEENKNELNYHLKNNIVSRQGSRSDNNIPINNKYSSNNVTSMNAMESNLILDEITNFKKIMKIVLENQNEFQNKLIDNERLINNQDNLLRLNNIKINEHDSKLTEVLVTFNNFMNFNEKTNKIIKDLSVKFDDSVKRNEVSDLKINLYNLNKKNEMKIFESNSKIEEIVLKCDELKREQDIFQKFTLEKLKNYQNEYIENKLQQQQHILKLEESRENKYNHQLEQIKMMINSIEHNLSNEVMVRKTAIENNKNEILQIINQYEEKLGSIHKSSLEIEQKILNFSKEYISTFNELFGQNNQNIEVEIKSLKNILTNNILNLDKKFEESFNNFSPQIKGISEIIDNNRISFNNMENFIKEKITYFDQSLKNLFENFDELKSLNNTMRQDLGNMNGDVNQMLNERINLIHESIKNKINEVNSEISGRCDIEKSKYDNLIIENSEKIELFKNQFQNLLNDINVKIERKMRELSFEDINFDSKIHENLKNLKDENEEFKKRIVLLMNSHLEEAKQNSYVSQQQIIDTINNKLEYKIKYLKEELESNFKDDQIIKEGILHKNIINSEEKLLKVLDSRITPLQNQVEALTEKFSIN